MGYSIGVDLGTATTAAALFRGGGTRIFSLGSRTATMPSSLFVVGDGRFLAGESAEEQGRHRPDRLVRAVPAQLNAPAPVEVDGTAYRGESLVGQLLSSVIGRVSAREAGAPDRIGLAIPVSWGSFHLNRLGVAIGAAGLETSQVTLVEEPLAAVAAHALVADVDDGEIVIVYDLGATSVDASLVVREGEGFRSLGRPVVRRWPRRATVTDSGGDDRLRLTLVDSIDELRRSIAEAGVPSQRVRTILVTGGLSSTPDVDEVLSSGIGRPVVVSGHPNTGVAIGAAWVAGIAPLLGSSLASAKPLETVAANAVSALTTSKRSHRLAAAGPAPTGVLAIVDPNRPVPPPPGHRPDKPAPIGAPPAALVDGGEWVAPERPPPWYRRRLVVGAVIATLLAAGALTAYAVTQDDPFTIPRDDPAGPERGEPIDETGG